MKPTLRTIAVRGFRSIRHLDAFELGALNVLIGANGAGKSNFVELFHVIAAAAAGTLDAYARQHGGAASLFYLGPDVTPEITIDLAIDGSTAQLRIRHATDGPLALTIDADADGATRFADTASGWVVYHVHDADVIGRDTRHPDRTKAPVLVSDGANLTDVLRDLRSHDPDQFAALIETVRIVAPFIDDVVLDATDGDGSELRWRPKDSGIVFAVDRLSDGSIRFLTLATALMQRRLPSLIVIDEPELGLHPVALTVLAEMIRTASERTQVIVSTQSPVLLDYIQPEEVILVNRREHQSTFERLDVEMLAGWLSENTLGELWQRNVLEGGPQYE